MTDLRVTDCCGRLLPVEETLVGDIHIPALCPVCSCLDGREHDRHVSCTSGDCPGPDWKYKSNTTTVPTALLTVVSELIGRKSNECTSEHIRLAIYSR